MDYIRRTVTFELRSIIRNCAIKPPEVLSLSLSLTDVKDYMYICAGDTTRVLRPRISIKTSNFIFKFTGTTVAPIVHVPCHRRARLPSSGVPCRFSIEPPLPPPLLIHPFSSSLPVRSVRCVSPSMFPSLPSRKTDLNRNESFNVPARSRVIFEMRDQPLCPKSLILLYV